MDDDSSSQSAVDEPPSSSTKRAVLVDERPSARLKRIGTNVARRPEVAAMPALFALGLAAPLMQINPTATILAWLGVVLGFIAALLATLLNESLAAASRINILDDRLSHPKREQLDNLFHQAEAHHLGARLMNLLGHAMVFLGLLTLWREPNGAISLGVLLLDLVVTFVLVGVISPAIAQPWGRGRPEAVLLRFSRVMMTMSLLLWPLISVVRALQRTVRRLLGDAEQSREDILTTQLASLAQEAGWEGLLDKDEWTMIQRIVRKYRDARVGEVMTPRANMICAAEELPVATAVLLAMQYGHSRIPIYRGTRDTMVGIFYTRDLLERMVEPSGNPLDEAPQSAPVTKKISTRSAAIANGNGDAPQPISVVSATARLIPDCLEDLRLKDLMREPVFVPESMEIGDLLQEMRRDRVTMAIVLDEYGGTAGLVSMEDILEEIVGEIRDEFDENEEDSDLQATETPGVFLVPAAVRIDDLNEQLGLETPLPEEEDFETLGGFLFNAFGRIPEPGAQVGSHGCSFEVVTADGPRIDTVRIQVLEPTADEE